MNDPASAEATYRPPAFERLTTARDVFHLPQPAPVLWRDPRTDPGEVDAVLSVGEVAILASAGGLGKSCLALAVETATAAEAGREYGNACGLRVKAGGAVLVSYEDSPGPDRRPPALVHGDRPGAVAPMGKPGAAVSDGP